MTHESAQLPNHPFPRRGPEPLPPDFGQELMLVDSALRRDAQRHQPPTGLSDRVFAASVTLLPEPACQPAAAMAASARRRSAQWWGRLSMAASVGLAFVVGSIFISAPADRGGERIAEAPAAEQDSWYDVVATPDALWVASDARVIEHEKVAYLLETSSSDSISGAAGELAMLVADLEM